MSDSNIQYDAELLRELRQMALDGAQPADLIQCIQDQLGFSREFVVPVLAYLCRAFDASLRIILPLREEMGVGPESRALRVVFWFAAAMLANEDYQPWDWRLFQEKFKNGYTANDMATWPSSSDGPEMDYRQTADEVIARGALTIEIDYTEALDLPDNVIRERIRAFAQQYRRMLNESVNGAADEYSTRAKLEFQMHPDGPKCRVICMIRTLKTVLEHKQQPALASV